MKRRRIERCARKTLFYHLVGSRLLSRIGIGVRESLQLLQCHVLVVLVYALRPRDSPVYVRVGRDAPIQRAHRQRALVVLVAANRSIRQTIGGRVRRVACRVALIVRHGAALADLMSGASRQAECTLLLQHC